MPNRSLIKQSKQVRGSETFFSTINMAYGEQAGREYASETFTVTSGVNTISCTGALNNTEVDNYIVISSGTAAGVYEITAISGTVATVTPTPTGTDASALGNKHYFKNIEDDLNYIRNNIKNITGEANWYDTPSSNIATLASGGGGVENHSELNELDYASSGHTGFASSETVNQNTWDISVVSGTLLTPVWLTSATYSANSNELIEIYRDGDVTITVPDPTGYVPGERIVIRDVGGYFKARKLTINVSGGGWSLTRSNDYNWYGTFELGGNYFSYELVRTGAGSWLLSNSHDNFMIKVLSSASYTAKAYDEIFISYSLAVTITFPAYPRVGERIRIIDDEGVFGKYPCTVNAGGAMQGFKTKDPNVFNPYTIYLNTHRGFYEFTYMDSGHWFMYDFTDPYTNVLNISSGGTTLYYGSYLVRANTTGGAFSLGLDGGYWKNNSKATIIDIGGAFSTNNLQLTSSYVIAGPGVTNGNSVYLDQDYGVYTVTLDKANSLFLIDVPYNTSDIITVSGSLQNQIDNIDLLPTQSGNAGKFLTTDGTLASWSEVSTSGTDHSVLSNLDYGSAGHTGFASSAALSATSGTLQTQIDNIDLLPTQSGHAGEFLTTDGSLASWATIGNDVDMTYVSGTGVWTYDGSFSSVPDSLTVFCNGIKQRRNDSSYYVASTVSGVLNINFGFSTDIDDWVNITYNS